MVYDFVQKGLPLDGIIASSEPAALGTLYALKRAGLRVPQDVKIAFLRQYPVFPAHRPASHFH